MKVGGNESATKYFQSHGGSAALSSKDAKTKYTSNAANKYKDELARRVEADAKKYPDGVVIEDAADEASGGSGTQTPGASGGDDDFFSSWDKPAIKRPSNPPSRTGTPAQRTASPFLNANAANGNGRPKSPLVSSDSAAAPPATARSISSTAIRKTAIGGAGSKPKPNILGAKKTKLGAKKVDASTLDFDEAEKKAREEAERKERLGYDPNEEVTPSESRIAAAQPDSTTTTIHAPTPISPGVNSRERSNSEMERLGMGVRRLGFGQVGAGAGAAAAAAPKKMGFGAVAKKPVVEGTSTLISKPCVHDTKTNLSCCRRIRTIRPRQVRNTEGYLIRRVLWSECIRCQCTNRGEDTSGRLQRRHLHLQQRVLRPARRRRRGRRGKLRRHRDGRKRLRAQVRYHGR